MYSNKDNGPSVEDLWETVTGSYPHGVPSEREKVIWKAGVASLLFGLKTCPEFNECPTCLIEWLQDIQEQLVADCDG